MTRAYKTQVIQEMITRVMSIYIERLKQLLATGESLLTASQTIVGHILYDMESQCLNPRSNSSAIIEQLKRGPFSFFQKADPHVSIEIIQDFLEDLSKQYLPSIEILFAHKRFNLLKDSELKSFFQYLQKTFETHYLKLPFETRSSPNTVSTHAMSGLNDLCKKAIEFLPSYDETLLRKDPEKILRALKSSLATKRWNMIMILGCSVETRMNQISPVTPGLKSMLEKLYVMEGHYCEPNAQMDEEECILDICHQWQDEKKKLLLLGVDEVFIENLSFTVQHCLELTTQIISMRLLLSDIATLLETTSEQVHLSHHHL